MRRPQRPEDGFRPEWRSALGAALALLAASCEGQQSALSPAGREADAVASLFWVMLSAGIVIWAVVIALAVLAIRMSPRPHDRRIPNMLIIGGGAVFPTIVLTAMLVYGLDMMRDLRAPADPGSVSVEVAGELWWWRVTYVTPDGRRIESANEVRLPRGVRTALRMTSDNVIHSFWVPSIGGKMDLIPGRTTELVLEPTRTGTFRGQCAEYCGSAHALMAFTTVVMEPDAFERWLERAAAPAERPAAAAAAGQALFLSLGCGACHTVRGTAASGRLGPDLTHVGSRDTLGAGTLPNDADALARWIGHTEDIKPDVRMPSFGMLARRELQALAGYLESLD